MSVQPSAGRSIAIIGDGPRALWALERLAAHLEDDDARPPARITVFGRSRLGAGAVYDQSQPDYLRINLPSSSVDVGSAGTAQAPSFDAWRERRAPGSTQDQFPSRALTGDYLAEQAHRVLDHLRHRLGEAAVTVRPVTIGAIARAADGHRWSLGEEGAFDEVMLAVGHARSWPGALAQDWRPTDPPLHPAVFPVSDLLARPEVRPGATIAVRGAALTAIDAVLALTLGRGRRPADCDLQIVLVSRTGQLMSPKPEPSVLRPRVDRAGDLDKASRTIEEGAPVLPVLLEVAAALLGATPSSDGALHSDMPEALDWSDPVSTLRTRIEIARGQREPDTWWGLGQAWRLLYGALVARQRSVDAEVPPLHWPEYHRWSAELERVAFGPPLVNAELLLEAMQSGNVRVVTGDVREVGAGADLVVDAVLPPPGVADLPAGGLLGRLRECGTLSHTRTRRGARTGPDARVLDSSGRTIPGLALIGRATEDDVIGNDTLIRTLHPQVDAWARSVLR